MFTTVLTSDHNNTPFERERRSNDRRIRSMRSTRDHEANLALYRQLEQSKQELDEQWQAFLDREKEIDKQLHELRNLPAYLQPREATQASTKELRMEKEDGQEKRWVINASRKEIDNRMKSLRAGPLKG